MLEREKSHYTAGMIVYCVGNVLATLCSLINWVIMARVNKRRIKNPSDEDETDVILGLTDVEDRNFIYMQ